MKVEVSWYTSPNGTTWTSETYNGHRYALTTENMTWFQAKDNATALGGYLTTVKTIAENDWLTSTFYVKYNVPIWIGANDNTTEFTWVWDSGISDNDNGLTDDLCGTSTNCRNSNAKWSMVRTNGILMNLMIGVVKIVLISGLVLVLGMIETVKLKSTMALSNLINEV